MNTLKNIKNNPIGFFDSGVGGLTVYSKFRKLLPNENCLYYGDTANLPYGTKSKEELITFAKNIMDFFTDKNVKAVVIACNTSSSVAYNAIKDDYDFKIYPIIQCCSKIIAGLPIKKLGIFATQATISSGVYSSEINKYNPDLLIYPQTCTGWVDIVENKSQDTPESTNLIKNNLLDMLKNSPDKIILGCTHYPYLKSILSNWVEIDKLIDPADYFVEFIKNDLELNHLLKDDEKLGDEEIFVTSNPMQFKVSAEMFYNVLELPTLI